ncbi:AEC family transporter [Dongshaea marina]|uniref:AEC family transporter n=1 Tax=Dongshaea marina TaxID=2047966 RepID=UPI000D3E1486|nr:AEC family transporter [Dongshaea marina]
MDILLNSVFPAIIPVFAIMAMGYLIGRKTDYDLSFATDITMYFTLPLLIFSALAHKWDTPFLGREFLITGVGALVIILGTAGLVAIYLKVTRRKDLNILYPTVMFINAGNLALSLDYFAFGYDGFLRGVLFQVVNTSLMYSLGVYMVGRQMNLKTIFKMPFLYASIAGTLVWVFHIELPEFALRGVHFMGSAALPVLVLMLGYSLKNIDLSNLKVAISGGVLRIVGGLAIASLLVFGLLSTGLIGSSPGDLLTMKVLIVNGSMPAALGIYLLAQKYDRQPEVVAPTVFASTLIGLCTIPIVLWGVNYFISG